jgi:hypothetical protein
MFLAALLVATSLLAPQAHAASRRGGATPRAAASAHDSDAYGWFVLNISFIAD